MARPLPLIHHPFIRRLAWYGKRIRQQLNPAIVLRVLLALLVIVAVAALFDMLLERSLSVESYASSFYWALTSLLGNGDPGHATTALGGLIYVVLIVTGVLMLGLVTGAIIAVIIDFLLKEGQGLGAAGYRDHIVVCGWNATARDLIAELRGDDYQSKVVVLADLDKNPAGEGVYFVRGDATEDADLQRAGIKDAAAALVFPRDASDDADMHSILAIMAIEHAAPGVRTVAEVNNPRHEPHFRRANVDELLVTSKVASHLLARSALYPGLTGIVTDIVSGGEGSELYRISLPDDYCGMTIDEVAGRLRREHHATLLSVNRGGHAFVNPGTDFRLEQGDDAVVVAESLGTLAPLQIADATVAPMTAAVVPSA